MCRRKLRSEFVKDYAKMNRTPHKTITGKSNNEIGARASFSPAPLPVSKGVRLLHNHSEGYGFAELLKFSYMVAPDVLGLKNGGFLAGFWLTGQDLESSTVQELEHLSEMMARAIH